MRAGDPYALGELEWSDEAGGYVRKDPSSVIAAVAVSSIARVAASPDAPTLARPKSSTLTWPSGVSLTLAGLRSRWTMPFSWASSRPAAVCTASSSASLSKQNRVLGINLSPAVGVNWSYANTLEDEINQLQPSQHYRQPAQLFWNCGASCPQRLRLLDGRVYADTGNYVYRDRALVIETGMGTVTDVGTQFSVDARGGSLDVAVREGRVDVQQVGPGDVATSAFETDREHRAGVVAVRDVNDAAGRDRRRGELRSLRRQ